MTAPAINDQFYTLQINDKGTCTFETWTVTHISATHATLTASDGSTAKWLINGHMFEAHQTRYLAAISALRHHQQYVAPSDYDKPATYAKITRNLERLVQQYEPAPPAYVEQFPITDTD